MESLDKRILKMIEKFHNRFMTRKVLKTVEEVEANTNETNLVAAPVVSELINNLGGCRFYEDEAGNKYVVGADSVPKKLGEFEIDSGFYTLSTGQTHTINIKRLPRLILLAQENYKTTFFWSGIENIKSSGNISYVIKNVSDDKIVFCTVWEDSITYHYHVIY